MRPDAEPEADPDRFTREPPEFTGVRRHYVFGLRTQLRVPHEGWTVVRHAAECGTELTCGGIDCPRARVAKFCLTPAQTYCWD
jgi:hypothetical protein